jgi:hypothetical protein
LFFGLTKTNFQFLIAMTRGMHGLETTFDEEGEGGIDPCLVLDQLPSRSKENLGQFWATLVGPRG